MPAQFTDFYKKTLSYPLRVLPTLSNHYKTELLMFCVKVIFVNLFMVIKPYQLRELRRLLPSRLQSQLLKQHS